jgi:hypothetical protein
MKYGFVAILLVVMMLSMGAFAYSMGVAYVYTTPSTINPLTSTAYFKFNIDINTYAFSDGPDPSLDFNSNSLSWYSVTDDNTWIPATYNGTGPFPGAYKFGVANYHNAQNGDFNFQMKVSNGQRDVNYVSSGIPGFFAGWNHQWSDENAPTSTYGTVQYNPGNVTIPVYCSDGMTAQEDGQNALPETLQGSGCKGLYYNIDGGAWTFQPGYQIESVGWQAANNIVVTETGSHVVQWCVVDRLDTNSCALETWEKTVIVEDYNTGTCDLVNMVLFVLVAVAIISFLYAGYSIVQGEVGVETVSAIGIAAVLILVITFVGSMVTNIMCVI